MVIVITGFCLGSGPGLADDGTEQLVFIPVKGQIEPGLAEFVQRGIDRAEKIGAAGIVLEIDTPGGLIASAEEIKNAVFASRVPVVAFVSGQAKSAGVLISLAAGKIYMTPGASIGAAEPIPNTPKILASWRSELESAADANGRSTEIAAGMADRDIVIEGVKKKGELISLSAKKAVELGVADQVVRNKDAFLTTLSQEDGVHYRTVELKPGMGERMAWWIINPFVSPLLLMIGFAGIIIEVFIPGFGVPGTVGLLALGLFFAGHMMAGVSGWLAVFIFGLGVIALLLEVFVIPGFGVAGILGLGMIVWSIFLASTSAGQAMISLSVAMLGSIVLIYVLVKVMGRRGMWDRLILGMNLDTATGYVSAKKDLEKYVGKEGVTVTPLRPAGTADLAGDRVDVVTEGGFVPRGAAIKVVLVEGGRVVVRPVK
ncbi:MAG: serine protease [Firmicutes bacterium HGW-Firmicutes-14]|jgi:membrane-bound serine protease (ClpP class)|nr:MAG: serine protease [Firmicutes bacterium HGW-Firmicutes-14]